MRPQDEPRDEGRLSDSVPGSSGHSDGAVKRQPIANVLENPPLPRLWAVGLRQFRQRIPPRKPLQNEAEWIVADTSEPVNYRFEVVQAMGFRG